MNMTDSTKFQRLNIFTIHKAGTLKQNPSIAFIFLVRGNGGKTVLKEVMKLDDRLGGVNLTLPP